MPPPSATSLHTPPRESPPGGTPVPMGSAPRCPLGSQPAVFPLVTSAFLYVARLMAVGGASFRRFLSPTPYRRPCVAVLFVDAMFVANAPRVRARVRPRVHSSVFLGRGDFVVYLLVSRGGWIHLIWNLWGEVQRARVVRRHSLPNHYTRGLKGYMDAGGEQQGVQRFDKGVQVVVFWSYRTRKRAATT